MLDSSQVHALAGEFRVAPARAMLALAPVAHRAGNKMKSGLRSQATGHSRLMGGGKKGGSPLSSGISYEVETTATEVRVEAGWFNPSGTAHLENIAAFGSSNNAPIMDITQPLRDEVPSFVRWCAKVAAEAL